MNFSKPLKIIIVILLLILLAQSIYIGFVPLFNIVTLFLLSTIFILHYFYLNIAEREKNPLLTFFLALAIIFYLFRLAFLPSFNFTVNISSPITDSDVNFALCILVVSQAIFVGGLLFSNKINPNYYKVMVERIRSININFFLGLGTIIYAISIFNSLVLGMGRGKEAGIVDLSFIFIFRLFDDIAITLIITTLLFVQWDILSRRKKNISLMVLSFFLLRTILSGGRQGLFTFFLILLCSALIIPREKIVSKKSKLIFMVFILTTIPFYIMTTNLRFGLVRKSAEAGIELSLMDYVEYISFVPSDILYTSIQVEILHRFDYFEQLLAITAYPRDKSLQNINIVDGFKSIINNLLPGQFFNDQPYLTRFYLFLYGTWDIDRVSEEYHSEVLTPYGEYYIYGGVVGGFVLTFIFAFFYQKIFSHYLNKMYTDNIYSLAPFIILYLFYFWFSSFGFDWNLIQSIIFIFNSLVYIWIYKMLYKKYDVS